MQVVTRRSISLDSGFKPVIGAKAFLRKNPILPTRITCGQSDWWLCLGDIIPDSRPNTYANFPHIPK